MNDAWPDLSLPGWQDTADTLHMWTQIVGKTRLSLSPLVNHWWQVPLYVTARGLGTGVIHSGANAFELEFDFVSHRLEGRSAAGCSGAIQLAPKTVATFYGEFVALMRELDVPLQIMARPVEVPTAIPFEKDSKHGSYDARWVENFWRALLNVDRVLKRFRAGFIGKVSPVHFFWGSFDMAVTRFSGRSAPRHPGGAPNCPDWVMSEAYSHEVSSAGFWTGSAQFPEAVFYAYAYPAPEGFERAAVRPASARFDPTLKEFVLPYASVRQSDDPDRDVMAFLQSTYEAAANLGSWDRTSLERRVGPVQESQVALH